MEHHEIMALLVLLIGANGIFAVWMANYWMKKYFAEKRKLEE